MVLRIKSLKELGKNVMVASGLERAKNRVRIPRAASVPQQRLWALVKQAYPEAEQEKKGLVPKRRYTVDIVIERVKLIIEIDGWAYHGKHKKGFIRDREKDRLLLIAGYRTCRFTAGEVLKAPATVMDTLDKVMRVIERERDHGEATS